MTLQLEPGVIKAIAIQLLGEPNERLSSANELRFGNHGSLAVDVSKDVWHNHEANEGGGVLGLLQRYGEMPTRAEQIKWLQDNGYLPPEANHDVGPRIVAEYDYRAENGELLFQVVRREPKDFRQRRPDGCGGWNWSVKGVRQVLYGLPELLASGDATVFIPEGEKDCNSLTALGLIATCNAGGAGKWKKVHAEHLKGRRVVVLPDNDDAGRVHAQQVVASLKSIAADVRVVELPGLPIKGDVSDWLAAGGTAEQLHRLAVADPAAGDAHDDGLDHHRNAPRPDPACLHGLIGEIARTGADTTEANPYAIALNLIAYMSTAVGRGPFMPVGNTYHHCNLFTLHVGRTGRGRKGDAVSLIHRLDKAIHTHEGMAPQVHRGGLSSREGLAFLIHDGFMDGKSEVPAIDDKRLLVIESEFANVLSQTKREGNTLSTAIRDVWDGVSIRPATKTNRTWASDPHIGLACAITPGELRTMLASRELTNGFANRFCMIWAERERILPFPRATPQSAIDGYAARIVDILKSVKAGLFEKDTIAIGFTPAAKELYAKLYVGELNDQSAGELINSLLERRAPTLLRLAMLFAICDRLLEVDVIHLRAALAWVRYWCDSVKYIFASALDEETAAETSDTAGKIIKFLTSKGQATRKAITVDCFGGHLSKDKIDAALEELLATTPAMIEVETVPTNGRAAKVYRLSSANLANKAKDEQRHGLRPDSHAGELSEIGEECIGGQDSASGLVRQVRNVREPSNQPQSLASVHSSPSSPSSHASIESSTDTEQCEVEI
jgi:hypothetical protein